MGVASGKRTNENAARTDPITFAVGRRDANDAFAGEVGRNGDIRLKTPGLRRDLRRGDDELVRGAVRRFKFGARFLRFDESLGTARFRDRRTEVGEQKFDARRRLTSRRVGNDARNRKRLRRIGDFRRFDRATFREFDAQQRVAKEVKERDVIFELVFEAARRRVEYFSGAVERFSERRRVAAAFGGAGASFESGVEAFETGVDFGDATAFFGDSAFGARYRVVERFFNRRRRDGLRLVGFSLRRFVVELNFGVVRMRRRVALGRFERFSLGAKEDFAER